MKFDLSHLLGLGVRRHATESARLRGAQYGNVTGVRVHDLTRGLSGYVVVVSVSVAGSSDRFYEFRTDLRGHEGTLWPVAPPAAA